MEPEIKARMDEALPRISLPRYEEIPDVGLYLEQTVCFVNDCLAPLDEGALTGPMISNYVKKGLLDSPVKKRYSREQIAHLIYITVVKSVLSMEDIRLMLSVQRRTYDSGVAYDYFRTELQNVLDFVFGRKAEMEEVGVERASGEKLMLRNTIITVAHKVYLSKLCAVLRENMR